MKVREGIRKQLLEQFLENVQLVGDRPVKLVEVSRVLLEVPLDLGLDFFFKIL